MKKLKDSTILSEEQKVKIRKALDERLGMPDELLVCPMCAHSEFAIMDGYFMSIVQSQIKKLEFDGVSIPTVSIICNNCGFVSQHAMGILKLLSEEGKKKVGQRFLRLLTSQERTK